MLPENKSYANWKPEILKSACADAQAEKSLPCLHNNIKIKSEETGSIFDVARAGLGGPLRTCYKARFSWHGYCAESLFKH